MRKLFALSSVALVALTLIVSGCAKKETETNTSTEATTPAPTPAPTTTATDSTMGGAAKTDTTSHM